MAHAVPMRPVPPTSMTRGVGREEEEDELSSFSSDVAQRVETRELRALLRGLRALFRELCARCMTRHVVRGCRLMTFANQSFEKDVLFKELKHERFQRGFNLMSTCASSYHIDVTCSAAVAIPARTYVACGSPCRCSSSCHL